MVPTDIAVEKLQGNLGRHGCPSSWYLRIKGNWIWLTLTQVPNVLNVYIVLFPRICILHYALSKNLQTLKICKG